jgi:ABC-2 type transport system ATP-binding protein
VAVLTEVVRGLAEAGIAAADIAVRRPTLDEVFLRLTGRTTGDDDGPDAPVPTDGRADRHDDRHADVTTGAAA